MTDPLPSGWTQHTAPTGHTYYYNSYNNTSAYNHPSKSQQSAKNEMKEKPKQKHVIPGADGWLRITTNKGNTFYFYPESKRSEWIVPPEISHAVKSMEEEEKRKAEEGEPISTFEAASNPKRARIEEEDHPLPPYQPQAAVPEPASASTPATEPASLVNTPSIQLSLEEEKSLFTSMLTSLNGTPNEINPMAPWDKELPKFISQPAYSTLKQLHDKQDAFNEWCKLRLGEKRAQKTASTCKPLDPATAYKALLEKEVTSTRTKWEDFVRNYKKERSFFEYGRDDRERERAFKDHLKQLGEKKRQAAIKADQDFFNLLSSKLPGSFIVDLSKLKPEKGEKQAVALVWREAKRTPGLDTDERYQAVNSSSRRLELFGEWSRGERKRTIPTEHKQVKEESKEEAIARALRERQDKVQRDKAWIQAKNRAAFSAATTEDSRLCFEALLVDAVRSENATLDAVKGDPRYKVPGLSNSEKQRLLEAHIARLAEKRRKAIHAIFDSHTPALSSEAEDVLPLVCKDDRMHTPSLSKMLHDQHSLKAEFQSWKMQREDGARVAFSEMLKESAFVDFWGRMRKNVNTDKEEEDQEEDSLLDMAKRVDLQEITSVIKNDARYKAFSHLPHKREEWIRGHLSNLAAPKKSVYQQ